VKHLLLFLLLLLIPISSSKATIYVSSDNSIYHIKENITKSTWENFQDNVHNIKTVILESNGGTVVYAAAIGRLIRQHKITTVVKTECFSACVLIFQSGYKRIAYKKAIFMLHPVSVDYGDRVEQDDKLTLIFNISLVQLGMQIELLVYFSEKIERYFSAIFAKRYNIATEIK